MNDNGEKKEIKGEEQTQPQELKPIVLAITFMADGKVKVDGPLQDRILCYGLLEMAKEVIYDFKNAKKIDTSRNHNLINFLRNRR